MGGCSDNSGFAHLPCSSASSLSQAQNSDGMYVCLFFTSEEKNSLPSLCSWICETSSCGLQKINSFFHQSMSLLEFRTFFQQSFSLLWDSEILFNNLSVTSGICKFLLKISHFFFFFFHFFFSGFFCLQASGFK